MYVDSSKAMGHILPFKSLRDNAEYEKGTEKEWLERWESECVVSHEGSVSRRKV